MNSTLWDVLKKSKCHPKYDKNIEERVFGIQMKGGEVFYKKDRCHKITLADVIEITGTKSHQVFVITSNKRIIPLESDKMSLSP